MPCFVGLDASKKTTSVCVVDPKGTVLREGTVDTSPQAIVRFLRGNSVRYARVGLESSSIAPWLFEGLARARLPVICIETRHAHGALKTQHNKTDRADARGIANLMRTGSYRAVHIKTAESQKVRMILTARRMLLTKSVDMQNTIYGLLLGLGIKIETKRPRTFDNRVQLAIAEHPFAASVLRPLVELRRQVLLQVKAFEVQLREIAREDRICQLLMTAPGVGELTALIYRSSIDVPERFASSRSVGPLLGLVPRTHQSGDNEWRGKITKQGDREARRALFIAAMVLLRRNAAKNWLHQWGNALAARRGRKRAIVAVARRLAITLHKMWMTGLPFQPRTTCMAIPNGG